MADVLDQCRHLIHELERDVAWKQQREWVRATSQIEFAAMLVQAGQVPGDVGGPAIETALEALSRAVKNARKRYAADVEKCLEPLRETARSYTIHCVGHAHIDMNWMWNWPETVGTTIDTITTVDALMDEYPGFTFAQSQASIYRILQRFAPWLLERVRKRIRQGRWEVTALTWVEADKNLACGEDICRQMLLTRRFFQETLGRDAPTVRVDFEPDLFGHPRTTPTIMTRGGARYMFFMRCGKGLPLFWFQGPDGSRLLAFDIGCYANYNGVITPDVTRFLTDFEKKTGFRDFLYTYGVGDHGGGPTRRDIENILWFQKWPVWPRFVFGTIDGYFRKIEEDHRAAELPVVDDELNYIFEGCYTSQARIKQANRMGPVLLYEAELWSTLAGRFLPDFEYPRENINQAWEYVCFNQFHDILPGSGVLGTVEYARGLFQEVQAAAHAASSRALRLLDRDLRGLKDNVGRLARHDIPEAFSRSEGAGVGLESDTGRISLVCRGRGPTRYFTVFNPSPWERSGLVRCRLWDTDYDQNRPLKVVTSRGLVSRVQVLGAGHYWGHQWTEVLFPVQSLPGCGYGMLHVEPASPGETLPAPPEPVQAEAGDRPYLMNKWVRLELDAASGSIISLEDRSAGREWTPPRKESLLRLLREAPHGMTAWTIGTIVRDEPAHWDNVTVTARGPWMAALRCPFRCGRSKGAVEFRMTALRPEVDIVIEIDWLEIGTPETGVPFLKMRIPMTSEEARATYTVPFGSVRHPQRPQETPSIGRVTLVDEERNEALTLFSDYKYGFKWWEGRLEASLLRGSYDPDPHPDLGRHRMEFRLRPHSAAPAEGPVQRAAFDFVHPLIPVENYAPSERDSRDGFLAVGPQNVLVSAVKPAENGEGLIIRLYEVEGRDVEATLLLHPRICSGVAEAWLADVHEKPIERVGCKDHKGFLHVPVKAFDVVTILLRDPQND